MQPATNRPVTALPELVGPDYNLYMYRSDMYKVVRFRSTAPRGLRAKEKPEKPEGYKNANKLPQAISRARRVCLELALCNDWKWFATLTIAQNNFDRKNLEGYYGKFKEWLKYLRKKSGKTIPYLLVPEQHGDGSWHMHGFFNADIDEFLIPFRTMKEAGENVPLKLVDHDYYNWPSYQRRFGFCSFGKIRNHDAAAFYATKYISKSFLGDARKVGLQLYYCSQGLNRAEYFDSVYGPCAPLNACLVNHYEFCDTGFFMFQREPGDDPLLDLIEQQNAVLYPMDVFPGFDRPEPEELEEFADVDQYYAYTQMAMALFENGGWPA